MDSPSKFFFSLEKKNGQSTQIHALGSEDGHQLTDIAEIRNRVVDFYVKLYSSVYQKDDAVFDSFSENLPTVNWRPTGNWRGP